MRFLILTQYYPSEVGAAQARLSALASHLKRLGHSVQVVTAHPNYPDGRLERRDRFRLMRRESVDGIPVIRVWMFAATGAGFRRLASYLSFSVTSLFGSLVAKRPDVVFVESPPLFLGVTGWLVARRFQADLILNVSDLWPDSVHALGLMREGYLVRQAERLELWLYHRATAITTVTEGLSRQLMRRKGVARNRLLFLPNGVDLRDLDPTPPAMERPRPTIVYAGTHGFAHGLDVVIEAAPHAPEIDFLLVGSGSEKHRLQQEVRRKGVSNVHLMPPVPPSQIADLYAGAVAGLSTLRRSTQMGSVRPAKILAIMACARPVLYAGSGEGAELVRSADAGVIVPPEDPVALAAAARQLVADPLRASQMGQNGRRYVTDHLTWSVLVEQWLRSLQKVLA